MTLRGTWKRSAGTTNRGINNDGKQAIVGNARPNARGETDAPVEFFRIESAITSDSTSIAPNKGPPAYVKAHLKQQQQGLKLTSSKRRQSSGAGVSPTTKSRSSIDSSAGKRTIRRVRKKRTKKRDGASTRGSNAYAKTRDESTYGGNVSLHYPVKKDMPESLSSTTTVLKPVIQQAPSMGSLRSPGKALVTQPATFNKIHYSAGSQKSSNSSVRLVGAGGADAATFKTSVHHNLNDPSPRINTRNLSKPRILGRRNNDDSLCCCCGYGFQLSDESRDDDFESENDAQSSYRKMTGLRAVIPKRKVNVTKKPSVDIPESPKRDTFQENRKKLDDVVKDDDTKIEFELFFPKGSKNFPEILLVWFGPSRKTATGKALLSTCMINKEDHSKRPSDAVSPTELIEMLSTYGYGVAFVPLNSNKDSDQFRNGAKVIHRLSREYCDVSKVPRLVLVGEEDGASPACKLLDLSPYILGIILYNANVKKPGLFHSYNPLVNSKKPKLFFRDSKYEDEAPTFSRTCQGNWNDTAVVDGHAELNQVISILDRLFLKDIFTFNTKVSRTSRHYEYAPDQRHVEPQLTNNEYYRKLSLWRED